MDEGVASGSLAPGVPEDFYARVARQAKRQGVRVVGFGDTKDAGAPAGQRRQGGCQQEETADGIQGISRITSPGPAPARPRPSAACSLPRPRAPC